LSPSLGGGKTEWSAASRVTIKSFDRLY